MTKKILIFSPSAHFNKLIHELLPPQDFTLNETNRVDFVYSLLKAQSFDLVILYSDQANETGYFELLEYLHETAYETKTCAVFSHLIHENRVRAFKQGADDVMAFPFSSEEAVLRIERLLLYQKIRPYQQFSFGRLTIIPERGLVLADDQRVPLRRREFQILACLLKFCNSVVTREMIIDSLWGEEVPMYSTIDSYIRRLRLLLSQDFLLIKTIRGFGYMAVPVVKLPNARYPITLNKVH